MSSPETRIGYLARVMKVLIENDGITVTNLAMLSRTNHKRCNVLLARLEQRGFVKIRTKGKRRYVILTERGTTFARRVVEVSQLQFWLCA
ncbi:helix-turn-helix domain-containing protein [Nitrososphaera viennensis]|nr:hypothetical protein [Nitrososphaera viennensis]UVS68828.1 hypothetical protein NWT39_13085 [Nitrososphaera viennensis]